MGLFPHILQGHILLGHGVEHTTNFRPFQVARVDGPQEFARGHLELHRLTFAFADDELSHKLKGSTRTTTRFAVVETFAFWFVEYALERRSGGPVIEFDKNQLAGLLTDRPGPTSYRNSLIQEFGTIHLGQFLDANAMPTVELVDHGWRWTVHEDATTTRRATRPTSRYLRARYRKPGLL